MINLQFVDDLVALRTCALDLALVDRRVSREQVDGQELISLSLSLVNGLKSLQFNQGSAALAEASVEEGGDGHQAVNILCLQFFLILDQSHGRLHRPVVIFLIQLSLAQQVEMDCLGSLPRICQSFVS